MNFWKCMSFSPQRYGVLPSWLALGDVTPRQWLSTSHVLLNLRFWCEAGHSLLCDFDFQNLTIYHVFVAWELLSSWWMWGRRRKWTDIQWEQEWECGAKFYWMGKSHVIKEKGLHNRGEARLCWLYVFHHNWSWSLPWWRRDDKHGCLRGLQFYWSWSSFRSWFNTLTWLLLIIVSVKCSIVIVEIWFLVWPCTLCYRSRRCRILEHITGIGLENQHPLISRSFIVNQHSTIFNIIEALANIHTYGPCIIREAIKTAKSSTTSIMKMEDLNKVFNLFLQSLFLFTWLLPIG